MKRILRVDPRAKLYLLLLGNFLLFFHVSLKAEALTILLVLVLLWLSGKRKSCIRFAILYAVLASLDGMNISASDGRFWNLLAMLSGGIRMMIPCIVTGAYAFTTTTVGEFVCAMRRMHVPESVIITSSVVIRFFPTIFQDYRKISQAMQLRGMAYGRFSWITHPFQTLEYVLVPLLMNSSYAAQDLSVAALTKGIGLTGKHTCLTQIRFGIVDLLVMIVCTLPLFANLAGIL